MVGYTLERSFYKRTHAAILYAAVRYAGVVEWQTRRSQKPVSQDMRVQLPPPAPNLTSPFDLQACRTYGTQSEASVLPAQAL